jgi:hypothetical protein
MILPAHIKKPEGLIITKSGQFIVASDIETSKSKANLFWLKLPETAAN